jgi:hypothetical protein
MGEPSSISFVLTEVTASHELMDIRESAFAHTNLRHAARAAIYEK